LLRTTDSDHEFDNLYYLDIPEELRLEALQGAVLLMPDENREALQTLLLFLNEIAANASVNQVNKTISGIFSSQLI
jgi:hypothetical protein